MPHYFESGFSVREPMWHRLGTVLGDHPADVSATCRLAGLDWKVARRPLYAALDPGNPTQTVQVPGRAIIVRLDRADSPDGFLGITTDWRGPDRLSAMVQGYLLAIENIRNRYPGLGP